MINQPKSILKKTFGYNEFRPLQDEIIRNVLAKNDTLVIMPTGGGKSLCYQIPALIFKGLTVVISPLISLMKDQVEQLLELGVPAVFLNSSLSYEEYQRNIKKIIQNEVKLIYLAPEALFTQRILSLLSSVQIDCFTIDEAHCISEWGHDFRPEYRQLIEIRDRFPSAVCIALTATATPRVQQDIKDNLRFEASNEFIASFNRENLFLQIIPKNDPISQTIEFLEKYPNQSGIIYCFSRKQVDELSIFLEQEGFSVRPYHAGLTDKERKQNQDLFIRDDVQIIVATIAFGMGINKPNIRFVVHFDLPKNIETYYQEIGRAGRDGLRSHCLLLFGYGDIRKIRYFIDQKEEKERRIANVHLNALLRFCETDICRRIPLLNYFGEKYSIQKCDMCDNCLVDEKDLVDITILAQKFLSCIKRTGEIFGANHIVDVLLGSKAKKVLNRRHHNLSTYGIGKEYSRKQWFHLSRQFIQKGLIIQDVNFGSLKLTNKAWEVLKGKKTVMGLLEEERIDYKKEKISEQEYDHTLFEILRKKRKELADTANVPPYVIFPDKTLIEISIYFPQSKDSLLNIHGIGLVKYEKYGNMLMNIISKYCDENQIEERPKRKSKISRNRSKPTQSRRHIIFGNLYNSGKSVAELMNMFQIKQGTVLDHLYRYLLEGNSLRSDGILQLSTIQPQQQAFVLENFDQVGTTYLKPIFDLFNGKVNYDELKLLRLYYLSKKKSGNINDSEISNPDKSNETYMSRKESGHPIK
ncbi:MAG: DNA helicase RecQ [Candidatus Cloacimonetes bacterium]|nr:DNA helicase RecQ [Candidatus Cloacimonadota bacterium]